MEPIIISASFFQEQLSLGVLGRTGEHEARRISFDCSEVLKTWPEATILCVCRRPCDTAAYPIPLTADGTTYTMPLMSRETAAAGTIKLELRAVLDDTVLKSAIFYGRILPSLNGQKDAPGNPLSDALNRLESTIADAQTLADEIRQKLDNGEFIGERGPQGEPGKDGSDANVTAENIQSALGYAPVKDVQVNGTSILTSGVANIPKAELEKLGLVACDQPWFGGLYINPDGIMRIVQAPPTDIDSRENVTRPVTGNNLDYAVKAAMCDGKGAAWNRDEKNAAQRRAGINELYELIEEFDLSEASTFERTEEPDGTPFAFIDVITQIIVPTDTSLTAGEFYAQAKNIAGNFVTVGRGYMAGKSSGNNRMGYTQRTRIRRGYWESAWGDWTTNLSVMNFSSTDIYNFWLKFKESEYKAINKIYETSVLPAGTHIRIFGVRA